MLGKACHRGFSRSRNPGAKDKSSDYPGDTGAQLCASAPYFTGIPVLFLHTASTWWITKLPVLKLGKFHSTSGWDYCSLAFCIEGMV